jgi:hypothetical protein
MQQQSGMFSSVFNRNVLFDLSDDRLLSGPSLFVNYTIFTVFKPKQVSDVR